MAYIALKAIRFDRFYAVGEIIPEDVVDPAMAKKHIMWGSIAEVDDIEAAAPVPDNAGGASENSEPPEPSGLNPEGAEADPPRLKKQTGPRRTAQAKSPTKGKEGSV